MDEYLAVLLFILAIFIALYIYLEIKLNYNYLDASIVGSGESKMSNEQKQVVDQVGDKYAYVMLVMKGDSYVPGALISAYSIISARDPKADKHPALVCMVTNDVSQKAREQLSLVYDEIVEIPYIQYPCISMVTQRQNEIYGSWIDISFTKWNMLNLTQYDKVMFVDADQIILRNIDHLFKIQTPAATFMNVNKTKDDLLERFKYLSKGNNPNNKRKIDNIQRYHKECWLKTGEKVPNWVVEYGLNNYSALLPATIVLLSTSAQDYKDFIASLSKQNKGGPFGFPRCLSGFDEQSIAWFYLNRKPWHFIHQVYNYIPWHHYEIRSEESPYTLHYLGHKDKPWMIPRNKWIDVEVWWILVQKFMIDQRYKSHKYFNLAMEVFDKDNVQQTATKGCCVCQGNKRPFDHWLINPEGQIECKYALNTVPIVY